MTANRISHDGNVIKADFRPRASLNVTIEIKSEVLYHDGRVMLTRTMALLGDMPCFVTHFLGDLQTGTIINL